MSCRVTHPLVSNCSVDLPSSSVSQHIDCFQFRHAQNATEYTVVNNSAVHIFQIELGMGWELRRLFSDPKGSPVLSLLLSL